MTAAPIFRGATRPACIWGVPTLPFCFTAAGFMVAAMWIWTPILLLLPVALWGMHEVTLADDQAFRQLGIWLRTRVKGSGNRTFWKRFSSFAPADYRRAK